MKLTGEFAQRHELLGGRSLCTLACLEVCLQVCFGGALLSERLRVRSALLLCIRNHSVIV